MRGKMRQRQVPIPSREQVEQERKRLRYWAAYRAAFRSTVYVLLVVAAVAVIISTLFLPLLQVSGTSMEPTLEDGNVILLFKTSKFQTGDLIGMYHEGKILLKRVIGGPGDFVKMDEAGNVYVNDVLLEEPYVSEKSLGECDVTFPYQVPDESYFVLGDHRSVSIDSRSSAIGCVRDEEIIGRVVLRIWPLGKISWIS